MNLPLFIAWRYVFKKKKLGVIHIISLISLVGIAVATMALIVVLSVFNGFTSVATDMLSRSNPSLVVQAAKGKTINGNLLMIEARKEYVIEESALLSYGENQAIVHIRTNDTLKDKIYIGEGVAYTMSLSDRLAEHNAFLRLTLPRREATVFVPEDSFNQENLQFGGVFHTKSRLDEDYVLVPVTVAQRLLDYDSNTFTALYIEPDNIRNTAKLQAEIKKQLDEDYSVKTIFEQEPLYYRVMKAEKLGVYIILAFIVFIATFNITGSLSLLVLDKKRDINILKTMGLVQRRIRLIYFYDGLVLSIFGALCGIVVGVVICLLQSKLGLIKISGNNFIIDAFPIKLQIMDILNVFLLVVAIGAVSIGLMVRRFIK
jgi:lipoprotein-releasing system permease protein